MSDRALMESAADGDAEAVVLGFDRYLLQEVEDRAKTAQQALKTGERYDYEKGRLDQARMTHSLAFMLAQTLRESREPWEGGDE